ncbi:class I SAM-dependent methyltransferase [Bradyrhizobium murdochi]|uniref:class I SAM-dependent methyltransferase n=1 Tax=Bradyrhizobium murdochi TaxID=1038859 RepID=UPI000428354B|nr:methyltransferase domain-containing protein [Bradyrhizobium murdochi]
MDNNAASFTGSIPHYYDQGLGPVIFVEYAADIAQRVAAGRPARVLETAAGTGIVTRKLRDALPADTQLTATDFNPPMLDIARAKFQTGEQVAFQPADAVALPFADASFDAIVCQFGLMFFPDQAKSFSEAYRVLAPGGRYVLSVWDSHRYNPFGRIAHEVAGRFFATDPPQFYNVPFSCHQIDPIKEMLITVGFGDIGIAVISQVRELPDVATFARAAVHGNPLIDQVQARGGVDPDQIVDAMAQAFRREFGDPGRMPVQAIVFSATKMTPLT